jgi:hypothetical protein
MPTRCTDIFHNQQKGKRNVALLRSPRNTVIPEADVQTEVDSDVVSLRRLEDHHVVRPLLERRAALRARLEALGQEHREGQATIAAIERGQAQLIAEHDNWAWPLEYRQAKERLEDIAAQERAIQAGLGELDETIAQAESEARAVIERALDVLERPHVEAVLEALQGMLEHNAALHRIQTRRQRLTGSARWHLVDGGLANRLYLIQRTRESLARAAAPGETHV